MRRALIVIVLLSVAFFLLGVFLIETATLQTLSQLTYAVVLIACSTIIGGYWGFVLVSVLILDGIQAVLKIIKARKRIDSSEERTKIRRVPYIRIGAVISIIGILIIVAVWNSREKGA